MIWTALAIIQMIIIICFVIIIKHLYKKAHTDMLTDLYTRRYFYKKMAELKRKRPVFLILIDIDNFKDVNDIYGHPVGDQVLKQFARILKSNTRDSDLVVRWGGEEFAVVLFRTDVREAVKISNRIKSTVENFSFSCENVTCKITVSMGIASTKKQEELELEQFIKIADEALYKAKEKKNCIICSEC
ncbi:MAG: hypothetical protein APF76_16080 [Desulfitibacter sp. BRH_c19]|nr:MAG: hypothetical protein APF76_16080 [Desulfitibacter sp. BRH_c19]